MYPAGSTRGSSNDLFRTIQFEPSLSVAGRSRVDIPLRVRRRRKWGDSLTTTLERPDSASATDALRHGGAHWQIGRTWVPLLIADGAPDWFSLENDDRARLVKRGHLRQTWRVELGCRTVYAKTYNGGSVLSVVKRCVLGDPGKREWLRARKALDRGVATVLPIAVGRRRDRASVVQSVFLTEGVESAVTLSDAWQALGSKRLGDARERSDVSVGRAKEVIESVASMVASAHERGFLQGDGHPGNILLHQASAGVEALLVDSGNAIVGRHSVSFSRAANSIAQLNHYFRRRATRAQRLRFLRSYLGWRPSVEAAAPPGELIRKWAAEVASCTSKHGRRLACKRDRRLRRNGKYFRFLQLDGGWTARVVLHLERRHAYPEPDVPNRSAEDWVRIIASVLKNRANKHSSEERVVDRDVCAEFVRMSSVGERLRCSLGVSPHLARFLDCHARRHRDLSVPLVLGYLEHRRTGLVDATALIMPNGIGREADERGG